MPRRHEVCCRVVQGAGRRRRGDRLQVMNDFAYQGFHYGDVQIFSFCSPSHFDRIFTFSRLTGLPHFVCNSTYSPPPSERASLLVASFGRCQGHYPMSWLLSIATELGYVWAYVVEVMAHGTRFEQSNFLFGFAFSLRLALGP